MSIHASRFDKNGNEEKVNIVWQYPMDSLVCPKRIPVNGVVQSLYELCFRRLLILVDYIKLFDFNEDDYTSMEMKAYWFLYHSRRRIQTPFTLKTMENFHFLGKFEDSERSLFINEWLPDSISIKSNHSLAIAFSRLYVISISNVRISSHWIELLGRNDTVKGLMLNNVGLNSDLISDLVRPFRYGQSGLSSLLVLVIRNNVDINDRILSPLLSLPKLHYLDVSSTSVTKGFSWAMGLKKWKRLQTVHDALQYIDSTIRDGMLQSSLKFQFVEKRNVNDQSDLWRTLWGLSHMCVDLDRYADCVRQPSYSSVISDTKDFESKHEIFTLHESEKDLNEKPQFAVEKWIPSKHLRKKKKTDGIDKALLKLY